MKTMPSRESRRLSPLQLFSFISFAWSSIWAPLDRVGVNLFSVHTWKKIMKLHCIVSYAPLAFDDVHVPVHERNFVFFWGKIKVKGSPQKNVCKEILKCAISRLCGEQDEAEKTISSFCLVINFQSLQVSCSNINSRFFVDDWGKKKFNYHQLLWISFGHLIIWKYLFEKYQSQFFASLATDIFFCCWWLTSYPSRGWSNESIWSGQSSSSTLFAANHTAFLAFRDDNRKWILILTCTKLQHRIKAQLKCRFIIKHVRNNLKFSSQSLFLSAQKKYTREKGEEYERKEERE